MADWQIKKPEGQCSGTGEVIEPGSEYYAALVETKEGLERRDFCPDFWEKNQPDVYCFWKTRMPKEGEKKKLFIDDDMLMAFFERLEGEEDPQKINFRFVLALILMRKRMLKYDSSTTEDGREVWELKVTGRQETVTVVNPHLTEDEIESLSGQMSQILQADL